MKYDNLTISYDDYKAAQLLHLTPRKKFKLFLYPLLFLLISAFLFFTYHFFQGNGYEREFYIFIVCIAYLALIFLIIHPWKWRKIYEQQKFFETKFDYEFTNEALCSRSDLGNATLPWVQFHKWKENKNTFIVYQSDAIFHLIPKRIFHSEEEINQLRVILKDSIKQVIT